MISASPTRRAALAFLAALSPTAAFAQANDAGPVVRELADLVAAEYPDPRAAAAMARLLRRRLQAGRYMGLDNTALAERLTGDLRAVISDQHLNVRFDPLDAADRQRFSRVAPDAPPPVPRTPSVRARAVFEPENYGIAGVRRLPGNIGLISIDSFAPLYDVVKERYGAAMGLIADTYAAIIDLRDNGGGHPSSASYLMSYFFDRDPFVLDRMVWRRLPSEENRTTRDLLGAVYGERRSLVMLALGFASGLPNLLIFDTLSAWLRDAGLSLEVIGFFSLATLAYSLKLLWAPLVDRAKIPGLTAWLGHRRSWISVDL